MSKNAFLGMIGDLMMGLFTNSAITTYNKIPYFA